MILLEFFRRLTAIQIDIDSRLKERRPSNSVIPFLSNAKEAKEAVPMRLNTLVYLFLPPMEDSEYS